MIKKVVFTGCSYTTGYGLNPANAEQDCPESPDLWVNLCHRNISKIAHLELVNAGGTGFSNHDIFTATVAEISKFGSEIETLFVQWTSSPRYKFNPGLELWNTSETFSTASERSYDIYLSDGKVWTREYIENLVNKFKAMHHPHWEILHLVEHANIIKSLAKQFDIDNLYFVNGLCIWDNRYFDKLDSKVTPHDYTEFTKKSVLGVSYRSDEDIFKLYDLIHEHYKSAGGISAENWINLYDSFLEQQIDSAYNKSYPGKLSNQRYYELIKSKLA